MQLQNSEKVLRILVIFEQQLCETFSVENLSVRKQPMNISTPEFFNFTIGNPLY